MANMANSSIKKQSIDRKVEAYNKNKTANLKTFLNLYTLVMKEIQYFFGTRKENGAFC